MLGQCHHHDRDDINATGAAATAALSAKAAIDSAAQLAQGNLGGVKVSLSLGSTKSQTAFGGGQNGFTLEASANKARGSADGSDLTYTNSHLNAGNITTLQSGGDTVLNGAVIAGHTINADIGGNLVIGSLQDKSTYDSKQTSSGVGVSLCIPPFCYGVSSGGSVSAGKTGIDSTYLSVAEQSGIKAGDGGCWLDIRIQFGSSRGCCVRLEPQTW